MADESQTLEALVDDVARFTGVDRPTLLSDDAPALDVDVIERSSSTSIYLIGLIGGKDVGKTSLANAIAGQTLATPTSSGEGTRAVLAYAHVDDESALRQLLSEHVPDRFEIVTHRIDRLRSQVLVDLPDIDSRFADHVQLTKRMLRVLLYAVWIQSVEKYADLAPQRLLAEVAQANHEANFLFCLNKIDQVAAREGPTAVEEISLDYARRIARTLKLPESPRVFRISASKPAEFDLPALAQQLGRARSTVEVKQSLDLAQSRQSHTIVGWLSSQRLDERLGRLERLLTDARQRLDDRVSDELTAGVIPQVLDDAALVAEIADEASRRRLDRWPVVRVIDLLAQPVLALARRNMGTSGGSAQRSLRTLFERIVPPLPQRLAASFAAIAHAEPARSGSSEKQWTLVDAQSQTDLLRERLVRSLDLRRKLVVDRVGAGHGSISTIPRIVLTYGAILWFPLLQPALELLLRPGSTIGFTWELLATLVMLLGATYILQSVGVLAIYFLALWAVLRYSTHRAARRWIARVDEGRLDPDAHLPAQIDAWRDQQLRPLQQRVESVRQLVTRIDHARRTIAA